MRTARETIGRARGGDGRKRVLGVLLVAFAGVSLLSGCAAVDQTKHDAEQAAKDQIKQQASNTANSAKQAAEGAASSVKDSAVNTASSVKNAVTDGVNNATTASKSYVPDMSNAAYTTKVNPLIANSGHCTWFAWGRAYEKWHVRLHMTGNAGTWYDDAPRSYGKSPSIPRADSIAVWKKGTYGHVAYVEAVDGLYLVMNEANWVNAKFGQHGSGYSGAPLRIAISTMRSRYGQFMGYVYVPLP